MARTPRPTLLSVLMSRLKKSSPPPRPTPPVRPFQAISIFRGARACEMARRFSEHRFLAREAPQLPLSGCTMRDSCECVYIRHKDRRGEPRRLIDFGVSARSFDGKERRFRRGRRAGD